MPSKTLLSCEHRHHFEFRSTPEDLVKLRAQAPLRDAVQESLERADTSHLWKELRWGTQAWLMRGFRTVLPVGVL
jgi:hypothetical protein